MAELVLVRHGETEWSRSGRHTGATDVPLTEAGRRQAVTVSDQLRAWPLTTVWASPMQRALDTARLAGFAEPEVLDDLMEWDYGDYEGRTSAEILAERPDWCLWRDGCPGGDSPADVAARADRLIARARPLPGPVAVFAHGHILRVIAVRWIDEPVSFGARLATLSTGSVSVVGEERAVPAIVRWSGG